jgi:hypothetical protein
MKILVTGSRDWTDEEAIRKALVRAAVAAPTLADVTVIHGAAKGADEIASRLAQGMGMTVVAYPAEWRKYKDAAGPIRNLVMLVKEHADRRNPPIDLCLAFPLPSSRGTRHMMTYAKAAGILVVEPCA